MLDQRLYRKCECSVNHRLKETKANEKSDEDDIDKSEQQVYEIATETSLQERDDKHLPNENSFRGSNEGVFD